MKNKPNMYRVIYFVMEGNNYAGGWAERSTDVKTLGDVIRFSNVEDVLPIYIEIGTPVDELEIQKAVDERRQQDRQKKKRDDVREAQEQLRRAKAAFNT